MPQEQPSQPIRIDADTSGYEAAMRSIAASTEQFGRVFSSSLRGAVLSGRSFDETLASIAQRISGLALNQAFAPLDALVGSLFSAGGFSPSQSSGSDGRRGSESIVSKIASIVFNVQSPDVAGFRKSETQISSMLARAVARGNRGL